MRKTLLRLVCILLSITVLCSLFISCSNNGNSSYNVNGANKEEVKGNNIFISSDSQTGEYFIKNGKSEYILVIPQNASEVIMTAIEEFNCLIKMATGLTFGFVVDSSVTYSENAKYISFGDTTLLNQAGIENQVGGIYDKSILSVDGCRIITKNRTIFLLGASDSGVVNAVYDFMKIYFNYQYYGRNCIEIDKNVDTAKLKDFDVTDVPDISIRKAPHDWWARVGENAYEADVYALGEDAALGVKNRIRRYKFNYKDFGQLLPIHEGENATGKSAHTHNAFSYVPASQAKQGWLSSSGQQLCYSASSHTDHFDEENFNALAEHCAKKIQDSLVKYNPYQYPGYNTATLTQMDAGGFCKCKTCDEWKTEDNGSISGAMVRLNNAIIKKVQAWMELPENAEYKREDFKLICFAYSEGEVAPVVYDKSAKKYVPANDDVVLAEGTGIYYAAIDNFHYTRSIYDDINEKGRDILKQWNALTDDIWLWTYGFFYRTPMYFADTFNFFNSDAYSFFANNGVVYSFPETNNYSTHVTWFLDLFGYMQSELMWNCSLDSETLINNYMKAMFKDAAGTMSEMFTDVRMHFATLSEKYGQTGVGSVLNKQDYYEPSDFMRWIAYTDKANSEILKYKQTNPALYEVLRDRIEIEAVGPLYCLIDLYGGERGTPPFDLEERQGYINRLDEMATKYPFFRHNLYTPLKNQVDAWR